MLHFRPVDPYDLRCAIMRIRVCKMYYAGARVGNYCVFAAFGGPHGHVTFSTYQSQRP